MGTQMAKKREPTALEKTLGSFRNPEAVSVRLRYAAKQFHLVSPTTSVGQVPEGCSVALSAVVVDVENETYDVGGGKFGLAKSALDRIGAAAGISWDAQQGGRLDDGSDPAYCTFRAVGTMRHLDGTEVQLIGTKEMDLRDGSPQVVALEARAAKKNRSAEPQIREMRLHILGHAETKARLRAIRSLGIRTTYVPKELAKPFVVARLMWTGQSDDPELRRVFAMKQADAMLGGVRSLYGAPPTQTHATLPTPRHAPPPVGALPSESDDFVDEPDAIDAEGSSTPAPRQSKKGTSRKAETKPAQNGGKAREPGDAGAVFRFGNNQGEPLADAEDKDLEWYAKAVRSSLDDPKKARFRDDNEAHLAEIEAELMKRRGEVPEDQEPPADDEAQGDDAPDFPDDSDAPAQSQMKL